MGKRKVKKGGNRFTAKVLGFIAMLTFFYVVNIAGGCQTVVTKASYDIDTNIIGIFR